MKKRESGAGRLSTCLFASIVVLGCIALFSTHPLSLEAQTETSSAQAAASAAASPGTTQDQTYERSQYSVAPVLVLFVPGAAVLAVLVGWFLTVFTGTLESDPNLGWRNERAVGNMVTFSYFFVVFALAISALIPAYFLLVAALPSTIADELYRAMTQSPVGIVKGCVHAPNDQRWELACDPDNCRYQWLVNIGGSAFYVPDFEGTRKTMRCNPEQAAAAPDAAAAAPGAKSSMAEMLDSGTDYIPVRIHGGLSVPWYVIIVSIMGGAVSMWRRVPEYQRRAVDPADKLSPAKASI